MEFLCTTIEEPANKLKDFESKPLITTPFLNVNNLVQHFWDVKMNVVLIKYEMEIPS